MTRRFPYSMSTIQQIALALAVAGACPALAQDGAGAARRIGQRNGDRQAENQSNAAGHAVAAPQGSGDNETKDAAQGKDESHNPGIDLGRVDADHAFSR